MRRTPHMNELRCGSYLGRVVIPALYGLLLIAVLVVVGGLIAYFGDRVGRNVGRRRLTLFGMRPRHTSVVISVFSGCLIAGASIAILSGASKDVRTALFHLTEIKEALASSQRFLSEQESKLEDMMLERDKAERELSRVRKERDRVKSELTEAQKTLVQVEGSLAKVKGDLGSTNAALVKANTALGRAKDDVLFQKTRVRDLTDLGQRLHARAAELESKVKTLQETANTLSEGIVALGEEYLSLQSKLRYGDVAFRSGEIVLGAVLEGGTGEEKAREALLEFLRRSDKLALKRGAKIEGKEGSIKLPSSQVFDEAVQILAKDQGKWVVRARANGNALLGEPVIVWLELIRHQLLFRKGQVIAFKDIDGTQAGRVEDQILDLLRRVNEVAVDGGMITDEGGTVGKVISGNDFLDAIAAVKTIKKARVIAVATQDTFTTAGPLNIRLEVEPVQEAAAPGGPPDGTSAGR
ncbi:MAG: DUF3084 domain-containing protein [Firmicutes bacterium]|nr:DUF3084 domain-containing protein [Bacillota bacterium]